MLASDESSLMLLMSQSRIGLACEHSFASSFTGVSVLPAPPDSAAFLEISDAHNIAFVDSEIIGVQTYIILLSETNHCMVKEPCNKAEWLVATFSTAKVVVVLWQACQGISLFATRPSRSCAPTSA